MSGREKVPVVAVLGAGLLLAWPAAWNGYPLVFADTGTYLGQAILLYLGWDRPAFYSLFLQALHWRITLWTVPLAQGLIAAHLLALALRVLDRPGPGPLLLAAGLLAIGTGLPWLVAQIMPDLFAGLLALALWLIGFGRARLGRWERIWLVLLATGMVAAHLSHLPLALGLALVGGALAWLRTGAGAGMRVARWMATPAALAVVALVAVNAAGHGRFSVSPFGSVFFAARLIQDGPAVRTLEARCDVEAWRVCALRDRLPMLANDFLWPPDGPLRGTLGGGKAWAPEASALIAATLGREPGAVAAAALSNALRQFPILTSGDGLVPWPAEPGPAPLLATHFPPSEIGAFLAARQQAGQLERDVARLVPLHVVLAWMGLAMLPWLAWLRQREAAASALCLLVLAWGVGNAMVTGGFSSVEPRYQGRIAWLFVFAAGAVALSSRALIRHPVERRRMA